ncbi:hypothetical protein HWV62_10070 [Athelia sp. TMB]|nr:hypothetical protein HWV62_10070 [Athelia sp. TMB]
MTVGAPSNPAEIPANKVLLPVTILKTADNSVDLKNRERRIELVDLLQTEIAPTVFQPKALYDGRSILFAPRQLRLPDGNAGSAGAGSDEVHYVRAARKMLTSFEKRDIGGGLEFWQGIFQSIRPAIGRLLVNVDVTNGIMYQSGSLIDVAMAFLRAKNINELALSSKDDKFKKLKSFLKGIFIVAPNLKRRIKIQSLQDYAGEYVFVKDTQETTVARHYKDAHGITIRYVKLFGVAAGPKDRQLVFPAEVCRVVGGQLYKKKLSPDATAKVVPLATKAPQARLDTIMNGIGQGKTGAITAPGIDYGSSPFLQTAGMTIAPGLLEIEGIVVTPPSLSFGNKQFINPEHGKWDMRNKQFYQGAPGFKQLTVVDCAHCQEENLRNIFQQLNAMFKSLGMAPVGLQPARSNGHDLEKVLMSLKERPQMVLFILPGDASAAADLYRKIKFVCDVKLGLLSQCVLAEKISKVSPQYLNNCALKINARLTGSNLVPESATMKTLKQKPVMIVGADVSHPGPGSLQPSITSIAWSYDQNFVKYRARATIQSPRVEMIDKFQGMMKFAILDFAVSAKAAPFRIIIYRDGVSEGEYDIVEETEIAAVSAAIDDCYAEWVAKGLIPPTAEKPKLTFVIVGKRHHIRFFPKNGMGEDRTGNCPAGFLAAKGLESPFTAASRRRDFYLQSHGSLQGTSRPAHYIVLRDENFHGYPNV